MYRQVIPNLVWTWVNDPVNAGPYYNYWIGEEGAQGSTRIKMRGIVFKDRRVVALKEETNLKHRDIYWQDINLSLPVHAYLNYTPINHA